MLARYRVSLALLVWLLLLCGGSRAQPYVNLQLSSQPVGGVAVQAIGVWCLDANANANVCSLGGTSSTVSINLGGNAVSSSNKFPVTDTALDALINSGALAVSVASSALPAGAATAANQTSPLAPVAPAAATASSSVLHGCIYNSTLPTFTAGQQGAVQCDANGRPYVDVENSTLYLGGTITTNQLAGASYINTAASALATVPKASAGSIYNLTACNGSMAAAFFRLFNLATAPTVGTSTPVYRAVLAAGTCHTWSSAVGWYLSAGIAFDVTTGSLADTDTTTITTANQVTVNVQYK